MRFLKLKRLKKNRLFSGVNVWSDFLFCEVFAKFEECGEWYPEVMSLVLRINLVP